MKLSREKKLDYIMQVYAGALSNPDFTNKLCNDVTAVGIDGKLFAYVSELVNNRISVIENLEEGEDWISPQSY